MKKLIKIKVATPPKLINVGLIFFLCIALAFIAGCKKDASSPDGGDGNTSITYINNSFKPVNITVNGVSKIIGAGSNAIFTGAAGSDATGTAFSSGLTSSGTQVGLQITWAIANTFPATGNVTHNLNVGPDLFFLRVTNSSALQMTKLYVNYGTAAQTLDNITIPNDGNIYDIGYYKAFTNSNARAESGGTYWYWASLSLPFTNNQTIKVAGN